MIGSNSSLLAAAIAADSSEQEKVLPPPEVKVEHPEVNVEVKQEMPEPRKSQSRVEPENPAVAITGRDILLEFKKGDVVALVTYKKICTALESLETWPSLEARRQLLQQFVDLGDAMDAPCELLVQNLLRIRWDAVPEDLLCSYRRMLCELGVRQLVFTEAVYQSTVSRFLPQTKINDAGEEVLALAEDVQKSHYIMAHQVIAHIVKCFPMSSKALLKSVKNCLPHSARGAHFKAAAYMRNLIVMQQYTPLIRIDVWDVILTRLVMDDGSSAKVDRPEGSGSPSLFAMDEVMLTNDVDSKDGLVGDERLNALDSVISDIMTYITKVHNPDADLPAFVGDASWLMTTGEVNEEQLFTTFMGLLETRMLMASHVRYVSFIWLYLASLRTEYTSTMLETLWMIVGRMPRAPADAKKNQGAAAYFAAFLARAKYVRIGEAYMWLEEMFQWLMRYVDQCSIGGSQTTPGVQRHGTFYAVCQAFFLVFSFRYRELVKNHQMDEIRHWGIGRVVHSQLEPLKYISTPLALCFSAISRSLQLVYCGHVLPLGVEVQRPFEEMFPLDCCNLKISGEFISSLMRRFSPLAEDVRSVAAALSWNNASEKPTTSMLSMAMTATADETTSATATKSTTSTTTTTSLGDVNDDLAFLDEEDFGGSFRDRCGSMITVYSSSPGLRSFDARFP